ncbi:MAG: exodeoxyribonuclease VII large subunit [Simkaniaceae bacterium]|nr:exodeoxyribonuclease VII large subunit [Simkaniaceae bacterium]
MAILTVTQLSQEIKSLLEGNFTHIQVKGEVSNLRTQASGHTYFSLKDAGSQVSCVLFKGASKGVKRMPRDGDQITISGQISLYLPRGSYQIVVRDVRYEGVGDLLLKLHELKEELAKKGYFLKSNKKPIPTMPKRIGAITSPTGSVIQDILNVLRRRYAGFNLLLGPVKVQGEGAAREIAQMIDLFNEHRLADVLIVGRGGGSLEDLWPFNEKVVAEAIFRSQIPIVAAVGHETDHSITDYVADVRAPTPSAAAELVSKEQAALNRGLDEMSRNLKHAVSALLKNHKSRLERFTHHPLFASPDFLLSPYIQRIDALQREIVALQPSKQIQQRKVDVSRIQESLTRLLNEKIKYRRAALQALAEHLASSNPKTILKKGYCIPFREKKKSVIMSAKEVQMDDRLTLLFHDGEAGATVNTAENDARIPL